MIFKDFWKNFIKRQYEYLFKAEIEEFRNQLAYFKKCAKATTLENPECLGIISNTELYSLLKPYCDEVHLSDRVYGLTSVEEAKEYSELTKVAVNDWEKDKFDCDEFSFALMGYWNLDLYQFSFGIAWSKTHAFNIFVDNEKKVYVVEPQSNRFYKIDDIKNNPKYYPLRFIII